jgi:hypothetical protein
MRTQGFPWKAIERGAISVDDFKRKHLRFRQPVIIENSAPQWTIWESWDLESLARRFAEVVVVADKGYFTDDSKGSALPFGELIGRIMSSGDETPAPYLRNVDIDAQFPQLGRELHPRLAYAMPNWLACRFIPEYVPDGLVELFIGGKGTRFPSLHFDTHASHAFITQVWGTKEVIMFSPRESASLARLFGSPGRFDVEQLEAAYADGDPKAQRLRGYRATLRSRETLFVPCGWWHTTAMPEVSISLSTNCVNRSNWVQFMTEVTKKDRLTKRVPKLGYLAAVGLLLTVLSLFDKSTIVSRKPRNSPAIAPLHGR